MGDLGMKGLSPVARFSIALAAILAATTVTLSAGTAVLVSRYVADETTRFTQDAVASHFGTVFREELFRQGVASDDEFRILTRDVTFHFSIYNVVATQFFDPSGRIVFSYDRSEIGRMIDPATLPGMAEALGGARSAMRTEVVADPRLGIPGSTVGRGSYETTHHVGGTSAESLPPGTAPMSALEVWIPAKQNGSVVGAVVVWRNMDAIDAALARILVTTAAIIVGAAILLWLVLRGVYVRSSRRIVAQAKALERALIERDQTYDSTLEALASALDVRDSETGGHSDRVLRYMELVIRELGIVGSDVAFLRRGALLHDIGKIGVPDSILRKPTALSESEWQTMRLHPEFGARIIAGIPFLEDVSRIVRHHHERWDGTGYPDGLRGDDIPLGARIFAVADSFDAMTSDRPYRRAMSVDAACAEIARCRGTQFDPVVADAFARIDPARLAAIADEAPHTHPVAVAG